MHPKLTRPIARPRAAEGLSPNADGLVNNHTDAVDRRGPPALNGWVLASGSPFLISLAMLRHHVLRYGMHDMEIKQGDAYNLNTCILPVPPLLLSVLGFSSSSPNKQNPQNLKICARNTDSPPSNPSLPYLENSPLTEVADIKATYQPHWPFHLSLIWSLRRRHTSEAPYLMT